MVSQPMELMDGVEPMIVLNVGPVLSSKTELALYFAKRYLERGLSVVFVKPSWDTRFADPSVVRSRSDIIPELPKLPVVVIRRGEELLIPEQTRGFEVVFIDEAQAFCEILAPLADQMYRAGKRVILNALDFTWELRQFATTAAVRSLPDLIQYRKSGFCLLNGCKHSAPISQKLLPSGEPARIFSDEPVDDPGGAEKYVPRCWRHWIGTTPGAREELVSPTCRFFSIDPVTRWQREAEGGKVRQRAEEGGSGR